MSTDISTKEENIEKIRENAIKDIKEKVKKNCDYLRPINKDRLDDMKRLGFDSGYNFNCWLKQVGIMKNTTDVVNIEIMTKIRNAGCKDLKEYKDKLAQKLGYKDRLERQLEYMYGPLKDLEKKREQSFYESLESQYGKEFADWAKQNKDNTPNVLINSGCKTYLEWRNKCAQNVGFENDADRQRERLHNNGVNLPMEFNEECSSNFGIYKGETLFKRFLLTIFECVEHMESNNKYFDFICKNPSQEFIDKYPQFKLERDKEYKFQLKNRCLRRSPLWNSIYWCFSHIDYNKKTDYFIFCGWNDRDNQNPIHIWIFHKDDIIGGDKFWRRDSLSITNKQEYINNFLNHELIDELKTLKEIQKTMEDMS